MILDPRTESEAPARGIHLPGGVVWITGFSSAGKTTVGRHVIRRLKEHDIAAVFLDGDDLRNIFADKWAYDRASRIELARIYFKLCSYLASQGITVVLAAVAMYDDVRNWLRSNIPNALEVYLDVPEEERIRRDRRTKNVYKDLGGLSTMYDEPADPDLRLKNYASVTPDQAAGAIAAAYLAKVRRGAAHVGKKEYWNSYYRQVTGELSPSPFARSIFDLIKPPQRLLEVGFGNGRDAAFLASTGHEVVAVDSSISALDLVRRVHSDVPATFLHGAISDAKTLGLMPFDVIYSRFVLHAMTEAEEVEMLTAAYDLLKGGGRLFIECRSINDPLARQGDVLSPTERIHGHYRRFIVLDDLVRRIEDAGFSIHNAIEQTGLAKFGDENPPVIRIEARR